MNLAICGRKNPETGEPCMAPIIPSDFSESVYVASVGGAPVVEVEGWWCASPFSRHFHTAARFRYNEVMLRTHRAIDDIGYLRAALRRAAEGDTPVPPSS